MCILSLHIHNDNYRKFTSHKFTKVRVQYTLLYVVCTVLAGAKYILLASKSILNIQYDKPSTSHG